MDRKQNGIHSHVEVQFHAGTGEASQSCLHALQQGIPAGCAQSQALSTAGRMQQRCQDTGFIPGQRTAPCPAVCPQRLRDTPGRYAELICCWRPNYHNESHMALPQAMRQRIHSSFCCLHCCSCRAEQAGTAILKPSQCTSSHPMAGMLLVPQVCPHPSITAGNEPQVVPNSSKGPFVSFSTKEEKKWEKK